MLPRPLCWLSSFASSNLPLEALDTLLTLQPSAAVAPTRQFVLQVFRTLADYDTSPLVLSEWKLLPEYLLNLWPSCFSTGCSSLYPAGQMNAVLLGHWFPSGGKKRININLTIQTATKTVDYILYAHAVCDLNHKWKDQIGFFSGKTERGGRKQNQIWDTFCCSSGIPNSTHLTNPQQSYSHAHICAVLLNIIDRFRVHVGSTTCR